MNIPYIYEIEGEYFSGLYRCETYMMIINDVEECEKIGKTDDKNKITYLCNDKIYIVTRHKLNKYFM